MDLRYNDCETLFIVVVVVKVADAQRVTAAHTRSDSVTHTGSDSITHTQQHTSSPPLRYKPTHCKGPNVVDVEVGKQPSQPAVLAATNLNQQICSVDIFSCSGKDACERMVGVGVAPTNHCWGSK